MNWTCKETIQQYIKCQLNLKHTADIVLLILNTLFQSYLSKIQEFHVSNTNENNNETLNDSSSSHTTSNHDSSILSSLPQKITMEKNDTVHLPSGNSWFVFSSLFKLMSLSSIDANLHTDEEHKNTINTDDSNEATFETD
eukprot:gb/GECH01010771.1/.p1 GENE.gb/GECH01010771.1/~~gb/GECH01010771.1/.p1  ORF type:complete len:140 (+),score=22.11 gb/GECH01010771.1/:1-420(+)